MEAEDIKIYQKIADEKALLDLEDKRLDERIDEANKAINDHALASTQAHNQLGERITLLSAELKKEIDDDIAAESEIINGRIDDEVETIEGKFDAIHNADTGILKQAQNYTDAEIAEMAYTDAPTDGQYVYSVSEANGKISVEHKALPTYTLTSG